MDYVRSPLFYVGDKYKLVGQLMPLFPKRITTFVEPFLGGASVAMNVNAQTYSLSDSNPYVAGLHNWLLNQSSVEAVLGALENRIKEIGLRSSYFGDLVPSELRLKHPKTYFAVQNKDAYGRLRADFNASGRDSMLDFYLLLIFGFNRMIRFNSAGDFNVPVGNVDFNQNVAKALGDYMAWAAKARPNVAAGDYQYTIDSAELGEHSFVYVDPPYLIAQTEYNKSWGESEENRLLRYLDELTNNGVKWALSNVTHYRGASNLILLDWASKYEVVDLKANYINYHDNGDKKPREVIVRNYGS